MENENNNVNVNTADDYSEQVKIRHEKLTALREAGADPYVITKYDVTAKSGTIRSEFEKYENQTVRIAGRIMSRRIIYRLNMIF